MEGIILPYKEISEIKREKEKKVNRSSRRGKKSRSEKRGEKRGSYRKKKGFERPR